MAVARASGGGGGGDKGGGVSSCGSCGHGHSNGS